MAYTDKFQPTDELINEINTLKPHISSIALPKFTGAISVSAVTSYELAIKDILIDYASSKHHLFGGFIQNYLSRLNGKINIPDLKNEIKKFDNILATNLETEITAVEKDEPSVRSCYQNLIQGRHSYVHANQITLSYDECIQDYELGKKIIDALHKVMV